MSADSRPPSGGQDRPRLWQPARQWIAAGSWLLASFAAVIVLFAQMRTLLSRTWGFDFGVFHKAATSAMSGDWAIYNTTTPVQGWDFLYPPQSLIVFAPFAAFGFTAAFWIFTGVGLAMLIAAAVLVGRLESLGRPPISSAAAVGCHLMLAANFAVWMTIFAGQVSFFLLLACVGFLWALYRGRNLSAGALIAAAVLLKIYPVVMLAAPLMSRRSWTVLGWALTCAVLITLLALVFMPLELFGTYASTQLPKLAGKASVFFTNQSIVSFLARLGVPRSDWFEFSHTVLAQPLRLSLTVATVAAGAALGYVAVRHRGRAALVAAFALCALPGVVTAGSFMYVFVASLPLFHVVLRDAWAVRRRYPLLAGLLPAAMVTLFIPAWTKLPGGNRLPAVIENLFYTRSSLITAAFVACGFFLASRTENEPRTGDPVSRG